MAFAAFCPIFKLNQRLLNVLERIICSIDNAVLLLSPEQKYQKYMLDLVTEYGIPQERIRFMEFSGDFEQDICRYGVVDVALDTFPYGGGLTSINALNMMVPIVTLKGRKHGERMTYSILRNLGVPQTIGHSEDEYVLIARRLAEDRSFRHEVRRQIKEGLRDSTLVDMKSHVSCLETAYWKAWRMFLEGKTPQEIQI